jgi:hypothetical protein
MAESYVHRCSSDRTSTFSIRRTWHRDQPEQNMDLNDLETTAPSLRYTSDVETTPPQHRRLPRSSLNESVWTQQLRRCGASKEDVTWMYQKLIGTASHSEAEQRCKWDQVRKCCR